MRFDLKEATTALIALMIVGVTLFAFWRSVTGVANDSQKDMLGLGLSLLGTVMGYYFGRMPSERRAESAEAAAQNADEHARQTRQTARVAVDEALDVMQTPELEGSRTLGAQSKAVAQLRAIRNRL
jgi:hypothetical protein